jgi:hypothetical protein
MLLVLFGGRLRDAAVKYSVNVKVHSTFFLLQAWGVTSEDSAVPNRTWSHSVGY